MEVMTDNDMDAVARDAFGIQRLHPLQKTVIAHILAGERQIVLLPTGYGKSLCFLVPALMLRGATLVVYPLLALMADQARRMEAAGIGAVTFKGGQTHEQRRQAFAALRSGRARVALAHPEVLQSGRLVTELAQCGIAHVAVDEAHCVSEWGGTFRPAYLGLGSVIERLGVRRVTAFTATASPAVLSRMQALLFADDRATVVRGAFDRKNLHYRVLPAADKQRTLLSLATAMQKPLIVFCGTRRGAEDTARLLAAYCADRARLSANGGKPLSPTPVRFYHAGLTKQEKAAVERWFFASDDGILCATCAYGMGVDKPNIRTCIHLDAPGTIEFFMQEAGRAGRDGESARTVLLWNDADAKKSPALADYATGAKCRRQYLLDYLRGEQTMCAGCDICDARIPSAQPRANGADVQADERVLRWVRTNRRLYTEQDAVLQLIALLNEHDRAALGMNVWDAKAVRSLLARLKDKRKLRLVGLGAKESTRLDVVRERRTKRHAPEQRPPTLRRRRRHLLHRLRQRYRRLVRALELLRQTF